MNCSQEKSSDQALVQKLPICSCCNLDAIRAVCVDVPVAVICVEDHREIHPSYLIMLREFMRIAGGRIKAFHRGRRTCRRCGLLFRDDQLLCVGANIRYQLNQCDFHGVIARHIASRINYEELITDLAELIPHISIPRGDSNYLFPNYSPSASTCYR